MANFDDIHFRMSPREILNKYGLSLFPWKSEIRHLIILITIISVIVSWFIGGKDIATIIFLICAFVIGYWQWREIRYESSLDKYYERLDLANTRLENRTGCNKDIMYVFMELDNLEYVIEKYERGYIEAKQAFRGLKTFYVHCRNINDLQDDDGEVKGFKEMALKWVHKAGYHQITKDVVENVCKEFNSVSKAKSL